MPEPLPAALLEAEWLEADGQGGFASGTVSGARSRRYHALLLAATTPPTGRVVLVNGLEVWLETAGGSFALSSQRYTPDVVWPDGQARIVGFRAQPWPQWTYRTEDGVVVSQEVVACHGRGDVALRWRMLSRPLVGPDGVGAPSPNPTDQPARLSVRPLLSGRDYHSAAPREPGLRVHSRSHRRARALAALSRHPADLGDRGRRQLPRGAGLVPQFPVRL